MLPGYIDHRQASSGTCQCPASEHTNIPCFESRYMADITTEQIYAEYSKLTFEQSKELADLLQAWFDKCQPLSKREFSKELDKSHPHNSARWVMAHGLNWLFYGN